MLKPLTLLCCFASCLKTDSSAQALVIVQRFKAQQNNSLVSLSEKEIESSRTTILKHHRPSKQSTKWRNRPEAEFLFGLQHPAIPSPAQPHWCNPQLLVPTQTQAVCSKQLHSKEELRALKENSSFHSAPFFCLLPTCKYCWENSSLQWLLGAVQAHYWQAQTHKWLCTGPQCLVSYNHLYVSLTWKSELSWTIQVPSARKAAACYKGGTSDQVTRAFVRRVSEYWVLSEAC